MTLRSHPTGGCGPRQGTRESRWRPTAATALGGTIMKIGQLIDKLKKLDPEMAILCYTEDQDCLAKNHLCRLFKNDSVDVSEDQKCMRDDGVPNLKLVKSPGSEK